jgi:hypothetical protein
VKAASATAILFASTALLAQVDSRDLDLRIQVGVERTRPNQSILVQTPDIEIKVQPEYMTGITARMLGELPGCHGFYYQIGGMLESSSKMTFFDNGIDTRDIEISYSYFSFGGAAMFASKSGFSIGAHLEGRVERVVATGATWLLLGGRWVPFDMEATAANYLRPWGKLSMDLTFNNSGKVRPLFGIEASYPLTKRKNSSTWSLLGPQDSKLMESLAPQGSFGFYFGFRL